MCDFGISNSLVYYTHIPVLIISLLVGFLVFIADKKNPINRNLFMFVLFFSFWVINDLLQWVVLDPKMNIFLSRASLLGLGALIFFLYFSYSFTKNQLEWKKKILFSLPYLPILGFMFTKYNAYLVDGTSCNLEFGFLYWYVYFFIITYIVWSVFKLLHFYSKKSLNDAERGQVKMIIGAALFVVLWFFLFIVLTDISVKRGFPWGDSVFLFSPIGMVVFIGMLAHAITKYHFLKIKLIAAQALVVSLIILVGSQFFFAQSIISNVLTGVTLVIVSGIGIALIRSVRQEVERKEELQLMADKLASANDALRKLDNAKTEFISIASHQLRTPVTAIKGFASLLLEGSYGEIPDGVKGALEKIYSSSERLVSLIEDLLNVSRIESGRMTFAFEKASVEKLIKELYDNFILIAKTKKFYLDIKLPEVTLPEIVMDYSKIRELVSNFIDNALKYTEKGGVTVKAEIKEDGVVIDDNGFVIPDKKSEFGKMVRITVSDTGIGIPKEEIPYLFKKFSRGKDVSRLHVGGTGLGLYVGKAIAEAHGGQVWVESDGAGLGSRFIIEIPLEHV